jgi:hypothetical protein
MIIDYLKLGVISLVFSVVTGFGYLGYSKIKQIGYEEAKVEYQVKYKEYVDSHQTKLDSIVKTSEVLLVESRKSNVDTLKGINTILASTKGKPLVIVKDGGCVPSPTFTDSISEINKQVNEKMKGKVK